MYARSYEANEPLASAVALPSDYHGVAFEKEEERALPTEEECAPAVAEAAEEKVEVLTGFLHCGKRTAFPAFLISQLC